MEFVVWTGWHFRMNTCVGCGMMVALIMVIGIHADHGSLGEHGLELRLSHGVVYSRMNTVMNSADFETFSFLVKKFRVPDEVFAFSLPCIYNTAHANPDLDIYRALIHDACLKFSEMFDRHQQQRVAILANVQAQLTTAEALLPTELRNTRRISRALFGVVSYLTKFLFGIPSESDMRKVSAQVRLLSDEVGSQGDLLLKLKEGFLLATNVTSQRLNELDVRQTETSEKFNNLIGDLKTWREQLRRSLHHRHLTTMALTRLMGFMTYLNQLAISDVMGLTALEQEAENYYLSVLQLTKGRLPPHLVRPEQLRLALNTISNKLRSTSGMTLSHDDISFYYKHNLVLAMHNAESIIINLKIPVHARAAVMQLYQIQIFSVPHNTDSSRGRTKITNLPSYIAFSVNDEYYVELSESQVARCEKHYCHHTFPIMPYSSPSCAFAVFKSLRETIREKCEVQYSLKGSRTEGAISLSHGRYLLSSNKGWVLSCPKTPPRDLPPCSSCVVGLPCGCSLHSKDAAVLPSNTECLPGNRSQLSIKYPFNAIILDAFYSHSKYHELGSDQLLDSPLSLSLPKEIVHEGKPLSDDLKIPFELVKTHIENFPDQNIRIHSPINGQQIAYPTDWQSFPWATTIVCGLTGVVAISALLLIFKLRLTVAALTVTVARLAELPGAEANPIFNERYQRVHDDEMQLLQWLWRAMIAVLMIAVVCFAVRAFSVIYAVLRSRSLFTPMSHGPAVSTIVVVLESDNDRVMLPVVSLPLTPSLFSIKDNQPRSIRLQNQCCTSQLLIDWGAPGSILFHKTLPIALPGILSVPITRSTRVFNIINRPHATRVLLYYDDVVYVMEKHPNEEEELA